MTQSLNRLKSELSSAQQERLGNALGTLPSALQHIAKDIEKEGGTLYIVGGWVRDALLGTLSKDLDFEVYGVPQTKLISILSQYGKPNQVGKAFGVTILPIENIQCDFALPRKEIKTGVGHKGFEVVPDPSLSFPEAASRRDFTINAMGWDILSSQLEDPYNGLQDLSKKTLRHVSSAFSEDPLRALRAVQFAARFEFDIHTDTQKLCAIQPLEELPRERLYEEFKKLLLKAKKPSIGLEWMRKMDLLRFFPELGNLIGVEQDPEWHPEGDVWIHNNMVVDEAAKIRDHELEVTDEEADFRKTTLMLGALCHDFGKPKTTVLKDGRWRSPAHDVLGERPTRKFLNRLTNDHKVIETVVTFVREHLRPAMFYNARHEIKPSAIRRLSLKVHIPHLVEVAKADHFGRTTPDALAKEFPAGDWLLEQSAQLQVLNEKPKPFLTGKMLLSLGMKPGPHMGSLIRQSFELQLEGQIRDEEEALEWAKGNL
jgi:tRNA nucleotidyltransferase (CCA-adding enzyme)